MKQIQSAVHEHIRQDDTQPAIEILLANTTGAIHRQLLLLCARLDDIQEKEHLNLLAPEDIRTERNQINHAVLEIAVSLGRNKTSRWWQSHGKIVLTTVCAAIGLGLAATLLIPKKGFAAKMDVHCDRVTFRFVNGGELVNEQTLRKMTVQNFQQVAVQADSLVWLTKPRRRLETNQSQLVFTAMPDLSGAIFSAGPLVLSALDFTPGALLTFGMTPDIGHEVQLDIQQSDSIRAAFYFQDSLGVQTAYTQIAGLRLPLSMDELALTVICKTTGLMFASSVQQSTVFYFHFPDSLDIRSHNLQVADLDFSQREDGIRVSSIRQASVVLPDSEDRPYRHFEVAQGEDLLFSARQPLTVRQISLTEQGIHLSLQGRLDQLTIGSETKYRNPSIGEWLWHTHRLELLALLFMLGLGWLVGIGNMAKVK